MKRHFDTQSYLNLINFMNNSVMFIYKIESYLINFEILNKNITNLKRIKYK
jgi:hypothetical protein